MIIRYYSREHIRSEACCTAPAHIQEKGDCIRKTITGGRYATFDYEGDLNDLDKLFDDIFGKWFPQSGETLAERPSLLELSELPEKERKVQTQAKIHIPLR